MVVVVRRLCALLCLRSPDLRHLLFRIDAGVTAVTTPRSFGSEAFPCVASKCHALRRSVGTNMGWRAVAYFCYPELILDGLVVILDLSVRTALDRHVSCGLGCGARAYVGLICAHL